MIAILGGLGAALAWTVSTMCSSRSSRQLDAASVVGWVMLVGLVVALPVALAGGIPHAIGGEAGLWLALAGLGNVGGLLLAYVAFRAGQVALVAPIVATEGAIAALIAVAAGESLAAGAAAALIVVVLGIALASLPATGGDHHARRLHGRAVAFALGATLAFGGSLYAAGRAGQELPVVWAAAAPRILGVPLVTIPLALRGRLHLSRRALPLVIASGLAEVLGFYSYTFGARHGIAIAAVLASQVGAFSAIGGFAVFGERLSRLQVAGVACAMAGVAILSGVQG